MTNNNATFSNIFDAEQLVRTEQTLAEFGDNADTRARAARHLPQARTKLYAMLEQLTPAQMTEYGAYRASRLV